MTAGVLQLQESGKLQELKIKWWKHERGGGSCAGEGSGNSAQLGLSNLGGSTNAAEDPVRAKVLAILLSWVSQISVEARTRRRILCGRRFWQFCSAGSLKSRWKHERGGGSCAGEGSGNSAQL